MPAASTGGPVAPESPTANDAASEGRPDPLRGTPPTRWDALGALGVAVAVMVVAVVWRSPIVPTDPWHYVQRALTFPDSVWIPLGFTRYGIILANVLPTRLFGNAEASYYFWQVISAGAMAAAVYLVGRRWWGHLAGIVAVVVLFTNSIVFYNLTRQYPDVMSIALVMVAASTALMARDREFRGRAAVLWVLTTGFLLGWSFEVRETALFAWPLVLAILWRRGTVLRTMALAALPVLGWAVLDVAISAVAYGDPLLKARVLTGFGAGRTPNDGAEAALVAASTRWDWFLAVPSHALETRPDGVWMVVAGVLAVLALLVRNWPLRLVSLSFITIYGLNLAAGGMLLPDRPFGDLYNIRYWIQYVPSIALAVGGLAGLSAGWIVSRQSPGSRLTAAAVSVLVGLVAVAAPVWSAVRTVPTIEAYAANGGDALGDLRTYLEESDEPTGQVWTDARTARLLPIFERPAFGGDPVWGDGSAPKRLGLDEGSPQPGDTVLLYSADSATCYHCRIQIDPWLEENPIPDDWDLVFRTETGNLELYRVT